MASVSDKRAAAPRTWPWAVALGLVAVVVNSWNIGGPSLMGDEAVTVSLADRSPGAIWAVVSTSMDAVHAAYYAAMHLWFSAFGVSAVTLRLPSAIALGVAVCGIVLIGARYASRATGFVAGILLMAMPAALLVATVGRSYAIQIALTTWLAFMLLLALERGRVWRWVVVGALVSVSVVVFLFTALVVAAFAAAVVLHRPWRTRIVPFGLASVAGVLPAILVALLGYQQRSQVSWIEPIDFGIFEDVLVRQWFSGVMYVDSSYPSWIAYATTALFLGLVVVGVIHAVREGAVMRGLAVLCTAWMVIPPVLLVGVSLIAEPLYSPQYLTMCAPAVALLAALGISSIGRRWIALTLVAVLVATAVLPYVHARTGNSHGADWNEVANVLRQEAANGDAVIVESDPWDQPHILFDLYPDETDGLRDITLTGRYNPVALWGDRSTPEDLKIGADVRRIWVVSRGQGTGEWEATLEAGGFSAVRTVDLPFSTLTLYAR
ncbi:mannosyltransferase [Microbacterium terrae]|uniref:Glycosyltransferase RgtA/B/C/D-like domain-containing protein n=1 Tax=Microbacterium terrae TaxID=69369 RepID=A0A0M2HER1_9MICO|nr:glycosyltransferase family 39 protein [Microbacterium terrae]KJL42718.1 hypothetical protein RS81_01059 [Microbacterium terrae]MBP1078569.1 mannosyltransferase [Microbacterium terrae]GLJ97969.1 hypothetical protein GCM10017594_11660 [Microbacterium terrae]